jgi:excisionase family DNA binding protein
VSDLAPHARPAAELPISGGLTPKEVAAREHVTDQAVYLAIKDGRLKATRISPRRLLIDPADVAAWRSAAAPSPADPPPAAPKRRGRPPKSPPPAAPAPLRVPLASLLHTPSTPPFQHVTRPRGDGSAEPINPSRFQPRDPTPAPPPTVRRSA